ncbi:MAG TPA: AAA family ATPase [Steroidobacteraceae bacterium]|nr:AAA family ATPase [Steroidobacteraceae bacterium]
MSTSLPSQLLALLRPEGYPHAVAAVQLTETHISWVFLTGELAYKIKRPVHYPFVDLRSRERRAFFCAEELRLNRRFAPELYLGVVPVTLENGTARISGRGEVIDHAVCMRQFRAADELGSLLGRGAAAPEELAEFGGALARAHRQLPRVGTGEPWGRAESIRASLLTNLAECQLAAQSLGTEETVRALADPYRARLEADLPVLGSRRAAGHVRECHGDLHVGNIVRYGGRLVAFDCMEFEPAFRWIDVAEEIAFLHMDLSARQHAPQAQAFLAGYLFEGGDYPACRLLRLYGVHRALVRAKVAALQGARAEHGRYLAWAGERLAAARPALILMCGVAGSGKTWLARQLASALGAVHLRSDLERRRIAGLDARQRSGSGLGEGLYTDAMSVATYARLRACAAEALAGALPVIVDATSQRRDQRAQFAALAADHAAASWVVYCHAPPAVLEARLAARGEAGTDASEAGRAVLNLQMARFEPISVAESLRVIDADTTGADVVSRVLRQIRA